jgi:rod shape-determining protein MreB
MDEDIMQYVRQKYNLLIGERMAERVKIAIGSAYPLPEEKTMTVRGRNLVTGLPDSIEVSSIEVREALSTSVSVLVDTVRSALDETPPELIADLMEVASPWRAAQSVTRARAARREETKMRTWLAEDLGLCCLGAAWCEPRHPEQNAVGTSAAATVGQAPDEMNRPADRRPDLSCYWV